MSAEAAPVSQPHDAPRRRPAPEDVVRAVAAALLLPGAVSLLDYTHVHADIPALLYILAIVLAAAVGGRWAGILAAAASFVPFAYLFIRPKYSFGVTAEGAVALGVFVLTALAASEAFQRQRGARARAERAVGASRQALDTAHRLQRAADALAVALTPKDVLDAVLTEGVHASEARAGLIALVSEDGEWLELVASRGYDERWIAPFARFPVAGDFPLSEAVRTGEGVYLRSEAERDARYPELAGRAQPGHGLVCMPLVVERGTIGGLVFSFGTDQEYPPERRALKTALARQAALALERSRLLAAERDLRDRLSFLGEASTILGQSLDLERTLERLSALAVPTLADWCAIDLVAPDGEIERAAVTHQDPARARWAEELRSRTHLRIDDEEGVGALLRTREPVFVPDIPSGALVHADMEDPLLAETLAGVELRGIICVPLVVGERAVGALTLVTEGQRTLSTTDFELAQELASRASVAVENAQLYREAERRADASLALSYVGDGVLLLDRDGRVRYWNAAAAAITGVAEEEIRGRRVEEALPGWDELVRQLELAAAEAPERARPATLPLQAPAGERWLSVAGVAFAEGVVYALRDVSEERALEKARSDFVATASHELRTPLAAVYGAARTLRRTDIELLPEQRETFLEIIESETDRLTRIVSQILLAGQLEDGRVDVEPEPTDLRPLVQSVLESARLRAPEGVTLALETNGDAPLAVADEDKLRQVLVNLVDNAIKYSPDGGKVRVQLDARPGRARIAVRDEGLGVPPDQYERIFEKFFRLDPSLTRGVGGSGLGLYISRELVSRMSGSLRIEPSPGKGSTFVVELPAA